MQLLALPSAQALGTGDVETVAFQLVKRYESGAQAWVRRIAKPVAETVRSRWRAPSTARTGRSRWWGASSPTGWPRT